MKICKYCGKEFTPTKGKPHQKFCKPSHATLYYRQKKIDFEIDWAAWKRDFALGRTVSNL